MDGAADPQLRNITAPLFAVTLFATITNISAYGAPSEGYTEAVHRSISKYGIAARVPNRSVEWISRTYGVASEAVTRDLRSREERLRDQLSTRQKVLSKGFLEIGVRDGWTDTERAFLPGTYSIYTPDGALVLNAGTQSTGTLRVELSPGVYEIRWRLEGRADTMRDPVRFELSPGQEAVFERWSYGGSAPQGLMFERKRRPESSIRSR